MTSRQLLLGNYISEFGCIILYLYQLCTKCTYVLNLLMVTTYSVHSHMQTLKNDNILL